jgi:hypothetical protein
MDDISPKKENSKNEIKAIPRYRYLKKKKIKNTGMKKGFTAFIINASSVITPTMFMAIRNTNAHKNTLLKVILNQFFTIFT